MKYITKWHEMVWRTAVHQAYQILSSAYFINLYATVVYMLPKKLS